jgi:hypothetical protein
MLLSANHMVIIGLADQNGRSLVQFPKCHKSNNKLKKGKNEYDSIPHHLFPQGLLFYQRNPHQVDILFLHLYQSYHTIPLGILETP